jgi:hypothetical protein
MPPISALDVSELDVLCVHCGKKSLQLLRKLIVHNEVVCPGCGKGIDISSKAWRALINEAADDYSKITGYSGE